MIAIRKYRFVESRVGEQFGNGPLKITAVVNGNYDAEKHCRQQSRFECQCTLCGKKCLQWGTAAYRKSVPCPSCQRKQPKTPVQAARDRIIRNAERSGIPIDLEWVQSHDFARVFLDKPRGRAKFGMMNSALGVFAGNVGWFRKGESRHRSNRMYEVAGVTKTLTGWAEICGVSRERIRQRFNKFSPDYAILNYPSAQAYLKEHGDMAKVVKEFPTTGLEKYLDGQIWELVEGTDFECSVTSFQGRLRFEASKCGKKAKFRTLGNKLWVQAVEK